MEWNELFNADQKPSMEDIRSFIGEAKPLWDELVSFIEQAYKSKPQQDYSKCPAQPGWNVKFKKGGKSLCTLYPMQDYFIVLIVVGAREENAVEAAARADVFAGYVKALYQKTVFSAMGKWLMIEVKDETVLEDIKRLIEIRMRPR